MKYRQAITAALTLMILLLASCGVSEMIYLDYPPTTVTVNLICDATVQDIYERLGVTSIEYRAAESASGSWQETYVKDYRFGFTVNREGTWNVDVRALDEDGDIIYEGSDSLVVESMADPLDMDIELVPTDGNTYKGVLYLDVYARENIMDIVAYPHEEGVSIADRSEDEAVAAVYGSELFNNADDSRYIMALADGTYDIALYTTDHRQCWAVYGVPFAAGYETVIDGSIINMKWTMVPVRAVYFRIIRKDGMFSVENYVPRLKDISYQWYMDGVLVSEGDSFALGEYGKWGIVSLYIRARCRGKAVQGSSFLENGQ